MSYYIQTVSSEVTRYVQDLKELLFTANVYLQGMPVKSETKNEFITRDFAACCKRQQKRLVVSIQSTKPIEPSINTQHDTNTS